MANTNYNSELRKLLKKPNVSAGKSSGDSFGAILSKVQKDSDKLKDAVDKSVSEKDTGSSAYGGSGTNNRSERPLVLTTDSVLFGDGTRIKNNIANVLKEKHGEAEIKDAFDKVSDSSVEKNVETAKTVIESGLKNGDITPEKLSRYPNMQDGLALFYAADEQGNKNAAGLAYEAAYTKSEDTSVGAYDTDAIAHTNNSEKNYNDIYFDNTEIRKRNYQRVYYGDIWKGKPQEDLYYGKTSKEDLCKIKWIKESDFLFTEKQHIKIWRTLANLTSYGEMQGVVNDMITHFLDGTGTEYRNTTLNKVVSEHETTKAYMHDFTKVFKEFLENNKGNIENFANSTDFKKALENNDVVLSKYAYNGKTDTFSGLRMAIHSWTESGVDIEQFNMLSNGNYYGSLKFTFIDNFGLNSPDVDRYGAFPGFTSWYILQHYEKYNGKYKPFRTIVTINYPFWGKL